jgi:uncharacterized repeat protein (TIGR03803 family)
MNTSPLSEIQTVPAFLRTQTSRVFAACALLLVPSILSARAAGTQIVSNTVPAAVAKATMLRPTMRLEKLNLSIGLPLRNRETLTNMLQQIYDPASPNYRHYLTQEQFTEQFGPTQKDYDAVLKFAHDHGLTVTAKYPNRVVVSVRGIVGDIERAFHISLNEYQHPTEARTFRAPDTNPTLDLDVPVLSIGGLDNYVLPHPNLKGVRKIADSALPDGLSGRLNPGNGATPALTGSGLGGNYIGKDLRAAYIPGETLTGAGQIVGLVEFEAGFYQLDINNYEAADGLANVPIVTVLLDGWTGGPGAAGNNEECSLDIQMAIGMAPGLQEVVVFEGEVSDDILSSMANYSPIIRQLSASWTYGIDATSDDLWLQMQMQGQTYLNASGDDDAYVGAPPNPDGDANVTVVGGTQLSTAGPAEGWTGEVVYNVGGGQGTGGGISTTFAIPTWQQGISMVANQGSTTMRNSPDVAMVAVDVLGYAQDGSAYSFNGTSCATPNWAAIIAMANQLAAANLQPPVGFLNPTVYSIGKGLSTLSYATGFHDITSGSNVWSSSPNLYYAVAGYDLCTGWGSPAGTNLVQTLGLSEPLRIAPQVTLGTVFSGPVGGPFTPTPQTYTLTNNGTTSINWALPTPPSWLDVSPTNGTLVPGGAAATVTLSIDPSAASFAIGDYVTVLTFTNLNDGFVQSALVTLAVETQPVITSEPTNESVLVGQNASFSVGIATNGLVSYQWLINGAVLTSANAKANVYGYTTSDLIISNVTTTNAANYSVIVSNIIGTATSSVAVLSIISSAPVIVTQPTNATNLPGATASFSVAVVGNTPYFYHWMFNGTNLANSTGKFGGATNATLYITNTAASNAGNYSVLISNSIGSVTSTNAILALVSVTEPPYGLNLVASFTGGTSVQNPYCGVVYSSAETAYFGTSLYGGADSGGTTYKVNAAGTVTREYSFDAGTQGVYPIGGLMIAKDGNLYGTSYEYGTYYEGTTWKEAVTSTSVTGEVQFNGDNGEYPVSAMMQASDGNLYGVANDGGTYNFGTLFRFSSTGTTSNISVLTSFDGPNGEYPSAVLVQGTDGNLYGTAENGGAYDSSAGTIYRISMAGSNLTLLHSFNGSTDGAEPIAGVIQGVDGNYYGTTLEGGTYNEGTVFEIQPSGAFSTLYSFTGGADGAEPWGGLVQATDGNLYGTTQQGGTYGDGTVFQIAPTGSLATIAEFDGYQGALCEGYLVQGPDGNLYGATFNGGLNGYGAFFCVVLTNGAPLQIGGQPASLSVYAGSNAVFAVATIGGVPLSYQWQQNGTNLTNGGGFSGATTAVLSISNVVSSNAASYTVIVSNSFNIVTSAPATLTVLLTPPAITSQPVGLTNVAGSIAFFAVTATGEEPLAYQWQENGVNLTNGGTISGANTPFLMISNLVVSNSGSYSVNVSNALAVVSSSSAQLVVVTANTSSSVSITNLHFFTNGPGDGANPSAPLMQGLDGNLYGTSEDGGSAYQGTIIRVSLAGALTNLYSFIAPNNGVTGVNTSGDGEYPLGGLVQTLNSNFFGTTWQGGPSGYGTLFRVTNSSTVTYLDSFTGSQGAFPEDTLVQGTDGNFYGTAFEGGSIGYGSIFRMSPSGTVTLLYSFAAAGDGANPVAGLIQGSDGNFYGTTIAAGTFGYGTAFSLNPNTLVFTTVATFDSINGGTPYGGLIQASNGLFYGTTSEGGANGNGTVYSLSTNTGVTTLFSFDYFTNGGFCVASLTQGTDGNLYGVTSDGGIGGQGTAFSITTNGSLTTLVWFDGYNGSAPQAALLQASNGSFYGSTVWGGAGYEPNSGGGYGTIGGGLGTIFSFTVPLFIHTSFTLTSAVVPLPYTASISSQAVAPAGDPLTFAKVSGPSWLSVASNGVVSGTPPANAIGTNVFVVSLTDPNGVSNTATMIVPVILDPAPTFLSNPFTEPAATVGLAYAATIATNATAPYLSSGDVLTFALVSGPSWLSVATNGALSGTPAAANVGTNTSIVSVTDLGGGSATATMLIVVTAPTTLEFNVSPGQLIYGSNGFQFSFSGPPGQTYEVLSSSNLTLPFPKWTVVGTGTFGATNVVLTDTNATNNPFQYYIIEAQ